MSTGRVRGQGREPVLHDPHRRLAATHDAVTSRLLNGSVHAAPLGGLGAFDTAGRTSAKVQAFPERLKVFSGP